MTLFQRVSSTFSYFLTAAVPIALSFGAQAMQPGEQVIVLNSGEGTVTVIDRATRKVMRTFPVGKEPHHLIPTLDESELVVANATSNDLVFLDPITGDVKKRMPRISDPYQLAYTTDKKWFVSISLRLDRVDIYSMPNYELKARIPAAKTPSHVVFSADSRTAYVTLQDSHELMAIDMLTHKEAWRMKIGKLPAGLWISPQGLIFVGIMSSEFVQVIDPAKRQVVNEIKTGRGAHNVFALGDGTHILVSNRVEGTITQVNYKTMAVVRSIKVGNGIDDLEVSADGKEVWGTVRFESRVAVIDMTGAKPIHYIPVGRSPHGIYFKTRARRDQ